MTYKDTCIATFGSQILHFRVQGRFTASLVMDLAAAMRNTCHNESKMIIHTAELTEIEPGSGEMLEQLLEAAGLSREQVFCTGEKGFQILDDTGRVIVNDTRGRCMCEKCTGVPIPVQ